ncbi:hypothetical protein BDZ97DRAFT_1928493 [Flammula alnicola]|nr:hypothetical protein BDZ97DRAFT_1928493 [Flammula alnicola]
MVVIRQHAEVWEEDFHEGRICIEHLRLTVLVPRYRHTPRRPSNRPQARPAHPSLLSQIPRYTCRHSRCTAHHCCDTATLQALYPPTTAHHADAPHPPTGPTGTASPHPRSYIFVAMHLPDTTDHPEPLPLSPNNHAPRRRQQQRAHVRTMRAPAAASILSAALRQFFRDASTLDPSPTHLQRTPATRCASASATQPLPRHPSLSLSNHAPCTLPTTAPTSTYADCNGLSLLSCTSAVLPRCT